VWKDDMLQRRLLPSTVNAYLLGLGAFLNWLVGEGVLSESAVRSVPLVRTRDGSAPPVFDREGLRRIVKGAKRPVRAGRDAFTVLRDETVVLLLVDTGMRASECAKTHVDDVNLAARQIRIRAEVTKGRYERVVTFGFETGRCLGRYLRARDRHPLAFLPELFLTQMGAMTYKTMYQIVRDAGEAAGVLRARPHLLRHTWAHDLKAQGVDTEVLMSLGGWRSFEMPMRYGRAAKQERAIAAIQRVGSTVDRARVTPTNAGVPVRNAAQSNGRARNRW
jgi:site-specific recombinase XerD